MGIPSSLSDPQTLEDKKTHHIPKSLSSNWCSYIKSCVSRGEPCEALLFYRRVRSNGGGLFILGIIPLLLKACASLSMLCHGRALHAEALKAGDTRDLMVGTSLLDMYAKCRQILDSRQVFDCMPERNVVTWNAMVAGYLRNGDADSASLLFEEMPERTEVSWIEMIDGFARNGRTEAARCLFDRVAPELRNVVTWTVMVDGYVSNGQIEAAREVFERMPHRNFFVWSSMVSGYFKNGNIREARAVFDRIPVKNVVNWNSLICGYAQNGLSKEALQAFGRMQAEGFEPDEVTIVSALSACAQAGALDAGKKIHSIVSNKGIKCNQFILNALVDMYAKCGDLISARLIFDSMRTRSKACWNSMIFGLAVNGESEEALEFFKRMEDSNEKPDTLTFLTVLSACVHGGHVKEGLQMYSKMGKYGLVADVKHYGCLVDLLGRAGQLKEAYNLIKQMPVKPSDAIWGALLGACKIHLDMNTAKLVMEDIEPPGCRVGSADDAHCVLLSNIYAASAGWEKAERLRMVMENKGIHKVPGCSSLLLGTA